MAKKDWQTVMLSKETKEKLKQLKKERSYEAFIEQLIDRYTTPNESGMGLKTELDHLVSEYLEPIKTYMQANTPDKKLMEQTQQLADEYNQMEEELFAAKKRIQVLIQDNERLKKKKR